MLIDLQQPVERLMLVRRALELEIGFLGAIEQPGLLVILANLVERGGARFSRQVRPLEQILVQPNRALDFALAPKEASQSQVQLNRFRLDLDDFVERLDRLVGLLVEQEVEALEIGARQRARLAHQVPDVDARRHPAEAEEQREAEQPPVFELHAQMGGAAGGAAGVFCFLRAAISLLCRSSVPSRASMPNATPIANAPNRTTMSGACSALSK